MKQNIDITISNFEELCDNKIKEIVLAKNNRIKLFKDLSVYLNDTFDISVIQYKQCLLFEINNPVIFNMNDDIFNDILTISDNIHTNMVKYISFKLKHHNKILSVEQMIKYKAYNKVPVLAIEINNQLNPEIDNFIQKVKFI